MPPTSAALLTSLSNSCGHPIVGRAPYEKPIGGSGKMKAELTHYVVTNWICTVAAAAAAAFCIKAICKGGPERQCEEEAFPVGRTASVHVSYVGTSSLRQGVTINSILYLPTPKLSIPLRVDPVWEARCDTHCKGHRWQFYNKRQISKRKA